MSFSLGLTGSIGMGKSTTAKLFAMAGCDVWDADAAVHRLYGAGGDAVAPLTALYPAALAADGSVDRGALKQIIMTDPTALKQIEAIVHPLVAQDREAFRRTATSDVLVFDIPLLFEGGGDAAMDAVVCVHVDAETQRRRVLDRGTMTVEQFEHILQKQMPIDEKLARSDFTIETDTLEHARAQVEQVLATIEKGQADA